MYNYLGFRNLGFKIFRVWVVGEVEVLNDVSEIPNSLSQIAKDSSKSDWRPALIMRLTERNSC